MTENGLAFRTGVLEYSSDHQLINDNLCDFSHVADVHGKTLGQGQTEWVRQLPALSSLDNRDALYFAPSSVLALRNALPNASVLYDSGVFPEDAAALAAKSDVALVIVTRHEMKGYDRARGD